MQQFHPGREFRLNWTEKFSEFMTSIRTSQIPDYHSPYMIGANGSVRGKKEFEPSSLAAESEPLLGPHLEDY